MVGTEVGTEVGIEVGAAGIAVGDAGTVRQVAAAAQQQQLGVAVAAAAEQRWMTALEADIVDVAALPQEPAAADELLQEHFWKKRELRKLKFEFIF